VLAFTTGAMSSFHLVRRIMRTRRARCLSLALQGAIVVVLAGAALVFLLPLAFGGRAATMLTASMAPTYPAGSVVMVIPASPEDIKPGDVVTFRSTGGPVTHRVEAIQRNEAGSLVFVTQGDGNEGPDFRPVPAADIEGRVVFGVPLLGRFVQAARTPAGLLFLIGLPCLALGAGQLRSVRRKLGPAPASATAGMAASASVNPQQPIDREGQR
jgi:signal peptidase